MIFTNILHIAIWNKQCFIALQFICNKPVIYWPMSEANAFKNFFRSNLKYRKILPAYLLDSEKKDQQPVEKSKCKKGF